jgi:hypothetical protein
MPVETPSYFAQVIKDHLALKERNSSLDGRMPIDRYKADDPFENHPLFKTEEQARIEDTLDGVQSIVDEPTALDWPSDDTFIDSPAPAPVADGEEAEESPADQTDESLWSRSRDFDWGD